MLLLLFIVTVRKLSPSRMFSPKKHQYVTYFFGNLFSKCNFFSKQLNSRQTAISQLKKCSQKRQFLTITIVLKGLARYQRKKVFNENTEQWAARAKGLSAKDGGKFKFLYFFKNFKQTFSKNCIGVHPQIWRVGRTLGFARSRSPYWNFTHF